MQSAKKLVQQAKTKNFSMRSEASLLSKEAIQSAKFATRSMKPANPETI